MNFNLELINELIVSYTNKSRSDNGIKPLLKSDILNNSAMIHSSLMISFNFFSHKNITNPYFLTPFNRISLVGGSVFNCVGENIMFLPIKCIFPDSSLQLLNFSSHEICSSIALYVVDGFMKSEGHKKNILNHSYEFIGCNAINFLKDGKTPSFMVTQNFGKLL